MARKRALLVPLTGVFTLALCAAVGGGDPASNSADLAEALEDAALEADDAGWDGEDEGPRHDLPHARPEPESKRVYDFEDDAMEGLLAPEAAAPSDGGGSRGPSTRGRRTMSPYSRKAPKSRAAGKGLRTKFKSSSSKRARRKRPRPDSASNPLGTAAAESSSRRRRDADEGFAAGVQSGLLTAGSFDDTLNAWAFHKFLDHVWDHPDLNGLAADFHGPISTLRVEDTRGRPVGDAKVRVEARGGSKTLRTGTDGRAIWVHAWDGDGPNGVQATVKSQGKSMHVQLPARGGERVVQLRGAKGELPTALDVALVIDVTGSMTDELEYLKVELRAIAEQVNRRFPRVDQRFALVAYRDQGDAFVTDVDDFADIDDFVDALGTHSAGGGGDYPESMHRALEAATQLRWRAGNVARAVFLVADAPPHPEDYGSTIAAVDTLRQRGVSIYPVAASGVAHEAELIMRSAAVMSGAQYVFLTDDSGVGNPHAEPHLPCYFVESLTTTMRRMLAGELSGHRVEVDADDVVRSVGRARNGVCIRPRG